MGRRRGAMRRCGRGVGGWEGGWRGGPPATHRCYVVSLTVVAPPLPPPSTPLVFYPYGQLSAPPPPASTPALHPHPPSPKKGEGAPKKSRCPHSPSSHPLRSGCQQSPIPITDTHTHPFSPPTLLLLLLGGSAAVCPSPASWAGSGACLRVYAYMLKRQDVAPYKVYA